MLNKEVGDFKIEMKRKENDFEKIKNDMEVKDKKLNAMTNLNRTLQEQIKKLKNQEQEQEQEQEENN